MGRKAFTVNSYASAEEKQTPWREQGGDWLDKTTHSSGGMKLDLCTTRSRAGDGLMTPVVTHRSASQMLRLERSCRQSKSPSPTFSTALQSGAKRPGDGISDTLPTQRRFTQAC